MAEHARHAIPVEEVGVVFKLQPDFVADVGGLESQVKLRSGCCRHERVDGKPVEADEGQHLIAIPPVEYYLKDGSVAEIALRLKPLDDLIKRNAAVRIQVKR